MAKSTNNPTVMVIGAVLLLAAVVVAFQFRGPTAPDIKVNEAIGPTAPRIVYQHRKQIDSSGFMMVSAQGARWSANSSLSEISEAWNRRGFKLLEDFDRLKQNEPMEPRLEVEQKLGRMLIHIYEGKAAQAYDLATEARAIAASVPEVAEEYLYTCIFFQGLTALRRGEDENCILCRGESSCILPISRSAVHANAKGSRLAIQHFTEYLGEFPNDLGVRWALTLSHMTLGEYPQGVDSRYLVNLEEFEKSEFDIGRFRDIGHIVGINRLNQAGGAILEDFDGDDLLDFAVTTMDPTRSMAIYKNKGDGTFEEKTAAAGLSGQLGGLYCCQTDYNNDGFPDIFICRGAWQKTPMRPSLLRNNGNGTFTDVSEDAGVASPVNSISACWADFDNDGFLDLFICCETSANRLYRNKGNGTFEDVAERAGVAGTKGVICKGANWIDYDNDGAPDLFLNHLNGSGQLFRNNGKGSFTDVTRELGIDGPQQGFSCWAWDYDNDGWIDIFATSYARSVPEIILGLQRKPTSLPSSCLYRNIGGKRFENLTTEAGLNKPYATMGSNFGDFDNDGFLDFYLGTGDPNIDMLVPKRMFKNVEGKRFADISVSTGTAHLQKGHGVSIGDWDRNGTNDLFIQMGGAIPGDQYHNILFQNPGNTNNWLNLKLVGKRTNRPAVGARIKIVTAGDKPLTVHRIVGTGSSFGANPFEQLIGVGKADRIVLLEIHWPTSNTTQTFRDVKANQALEIVEYGTEFRVRNYKPISLLTK